ncbi:DNA mismatch repair protein MutL, partial [Lyophyllum atratum]
IKPIDKTSIHRITSGQVVIDLQTAVKELVENSLDAGATNIEVRFKQYGLRSIEVIDNGSGIAEDYHDSIALKHYTSKLTSFSDLATVRTFGFRGEALSSLCALSETLFVTTATEPPMGVSLEMESSGTVRKRTKVARQRGTTVALTNLFAPLPVRRKEFERNSKREFGKALALLNAYALGPCCTAGAGVRLTVSNQIDKGYKTVQLRTSGASSTRASVSALWGPKALDNIVDLDLTFEVEKDKTSLRRIQTDTTPGDADPVTVSVKGLISKFSVGGGRTGTDRQFFYINGRPCNLTKIQKAFNEVYRSFSANQAPFILADFILPTDSCDINVSPDKRTIFLHSEGNLITKLKTALEEAFAPSRSTYDVGTSQTQRTLQSTLTTPSSRPPTHKRTRSEAEEADVPDEHQPGPSKKRPPPPPPSVAHAEDEELDAWEDHTMSSEPLSDDIDLGTASSAKPTAPSDPPTGQVVSPTVSQLVSGRASHRPEPSSSSPSPPASPTVTQMVNARSGRGDDIDDGMDVDQGDRPQSEDTPSLVASPERGRAATEPQEEEEPQDGEEEEREEKGPPPKKKKDAPPVGGPSGRQRGSRSGGSGKETGRAKYSAKMSRDDLRNKLAGFARTGSQMPASRGVVEDEEEGEESQDEEEGEESQEEKDREEEDMYRGDATDDMDEDELDPSSDVEPFAEEESLRKRPDGTRRQVVGPLTPAQEKDFGQSSFKAIDLTSDDGLDDSSITPVFEDTSSSLRSDEPISRPEVIRNSDHGHGDVTLRFDVNRISATWGRLRKEISSSFDTGTEAEVGSLPRVPSDAGVSNTENDERAVDALARVIDKKDFAAMDIIGQFNLGFIVTRRRKTVGGGDSDGDGNEERKETVMDDLFIVDQHAADEKYNFETLQQTTSIASQKLFRPRAMELTASDELLALENMDVLRQNGFEVEESGEDEARQGARLWLTAQPVSKSTVFDMQDLEELIHLMRDRPMGQMVRCSKARAMFAMRACRKSVMVGMPLNKQQMSLVVNHMGTMDQPWNCPHGRPTMRHLLDLARPRMGLRARTRQGKINWSALCS